MKNPASIVRWITLGLVGCALLGAGLLWHFGPLAEWVTPARINAAIRSISASPSWPLLVIGVYIIAGLVAFPLTLLVVATALIVGPLGAFTCALLGAVSSASIGWWIGHAVGRQSLIELLGSRAERIAHATERRGILAIAVLRNLPVAPFAVINFAAGALGIHLRTFILGTLIGIAPGVAILCLMGDQLRIIWENPQPAHFVVVALVALAWVSMAVAVRTWLTKSADPQADGLTKHSVELET